MASNNNIIDEDLGPLGCSCGGIPRKPPPLRILVLRQKLDTIYGFKGSTIRQMSQQSGARIHIHRKGESGAFENDEDYASLSIYGDSDSCSLACRKILEIMQQKEKHPLKMIAQNKFIEQISAGTDNVIHHIAEKTNTEITVSSRGEHNLFMQGAAVNRYKFERTLTIRGSLQDMCNAQKIMSEKLTESFNMDLGAMAPAVIQWIPLENVPPPPPNYGRSHQNPSPSEEEVFLYVPNSIVEVFLGTQGRAISHMINSYGGSIVISKNNEDEPIGQEACRKFSIFGSAEVQWMAHYVLFQKVAAEAQVSHLRTKFFIPTRQKGWVIGKDGEMQEALQRETKAIIHFPMFQEFPGCEETPIHVTGDFYSTQDATRRIRALVNKGVMRRYHKRTCGLFPSTSSGQQA